jgi:hypothetical protein
MINEGHDGVDYIRREFEMHKRLDVLFWDIE